MLAALATISLAQTPFPFPQDCSHYNASSTVPDWFSDCENAAGGCFSITAPDETEYNVGNTTFGESASGGVQWCIDHLQGFIYNKVVDPVGAMYYEVDDIQSPPPTWQCRFLVGAETLANGTTVYQARTYAESGLSCTLTYKGEVSKGVKLYDLDVKPVQKQQAA